MVLKGSRGNYVLIVVVTPVCACAEHLTFTLAFTILGNGGCQEIIIQICGTHRHDSSILKEGRVPQNHISAFQ